MPEDTRADEVSPPGVEVEGCGELDWRNLKNFFRCLPMRLDSFAACGRSLTIVNKGKSQDL